MTKIEGLGLGRLEHRKDDYIIDVMKYRMFSFRFDEWVGHKGY